MTIKTYRQDIQDLTNSSIFRKIKTLINIISDIIRTNLLLKYAYIGNNQAMREVHYGATLYLDLLDNSVVPTILRTGYYEYNITTLIDLLVKEGDTTIDIGCNFGFHTLHQAKLVGNKGKVYAFECNPHLIPFLRKSIWANRFFSWIELYNAAVSNQDGSSKFAFVRQQCGGAGIVIGNQYEIATTYPHSVNNTPKEIKVSYTDADTAWGGYEYIDVKTITLDNLITDPNIKIDFWHMDAEGSEPMIICGAKELIKRSPNLKIISEWSMGRPYSETQTALIDEAIEFLLQEKFKFYIIHNSKGNRYLNPPHLEHVEPYQLKSLPHSDLLILRA